MELLLYGTAACHLCEQAKEILWPVLEDFPFRLREIDIADSDDLLERYGIRIPVLKFADEARDLSWPFDTTQARLFLQQRIDRQ